MFAFPYRALLPLVLLASACVGTNTDLGPPAILEVAGGSGQAAAIRTAVGTPPSVRVRDIRGNALPGITILFSTEAGHGTVTGAIVSTDNEGIAKVGSWTLGTVVGEQRLTAQVQSLDIKTQIAAQALAGPAAGIVAIQPVNYAALTGAAVTPAPTVYVTDASGNPRAGATVTFTIQEGGGALTGATATTAADGRASVGSWQLGLTAGMNRLSASVAAGGSVSFHAQGLSSPPASLLPTSPTEQQGYLDFQVERVPRVQVRNSAGQPLTNIPVTFTVVSGGDATIAGATAVSGANGVAALGDWRLGKVGTSSTVQATIPGFPGPLATFQATGQARPFTIDLRLLTTMSPNARDGMVAAARRWMQVVTGPLPGVTVNLPQANSCGPGTPAISQTVTNLIIYAQVVRLDGPGGIIASAGPCVRRTPSYHTAIGSLRLDEDDVALMDASGRLLSVMTHEMAHVFGFGTSWSEKGLVSGIGGTDPTYTGTIANTLWPSYLMNYEGIPIPLETQGGSGTRDAHWRKTVFGNELMTGFIEPPGNPMPLSKLTIAVLHDFGYVVSYDSADSYRGNLLAGLLADRYPPVRLHEELELPRFDVSADGTLRPVARSGTP